MCSNKSDVLPEKLITEEKLGDICREILGKEVLSQDELEKISQRFNELLSYESKLVK